MQDSEITPWQLVMRYRKILNSSCKDGLNIYQDSSLSRFGVWGRSRNGPNPLSEHWSIPFEESLELHRRGELLERLETELAIAKMLGYT